MENESDTSYVPPFKEVRLIECMDCIALAPVPAYREFFAYGKKKAREVTFEKENGEKELFWDDCTEDEEVWAVVQWIRFEDGHQEEGTVRYMRAPATEEDARKALQKMVRFYSMSKEELLALRKCFKGTKEDDEYIESRYPNYQAPPAGPNSAAEHDLYQARLKVLAGMAPKTVELIGKADAAGRDERQ